MAILRLKEIRAMRQEEMDRKLSELRLELGKLRGSAAVGAAVQNPGKAREIRKTIARMLTIKSLAKHRASQRLVHGTEKTRRFSRTRHKEPTVLCAKKPKGFLLN